MENVYRTSQKEGVFKHPIKEEELKFSQKKNRWPKDRKEDKESYLAKRELGSGLSDKNFQRTDPEPSNIISELQGTLAKLL